MSFADSGIGDMVIYASEAGLRLYVLSAEGNAISVFDPDNGMAEVAQYHFAGGNMAGSTPGLMLDLAGGAPALMVYGATGNGLLRYDIGADGALSDAEHFVASPSPFLATDVVRVGNREFVFSTSQVETGVLCWEENSAGQMEVAARINIGGAAGGVDLQAMTHIARAGESFLLVASAQDNTLTAMRVDASGDARMSGQLTSGLDMWVNTPTALRTAQVAGEDYVLMSASGSGSLVVARLDESGGLEMVDQVNDTQQTRFSGIATFEVIEAGGQCFVITGGSDDGLTFMRLLPGGRLLEMQSIINSEAMPLSDVSAITAVSVADGIEIYVAGENGLSIIALQIPTNALGVQEIGDDGNDLLTGTGLDDVLMGAGGHDTLKGGAGDDILMDGRGADVLYGGEGADVFIISADGQSDRIMDFEIGVDRIDLSGIGNAYTLEALQFETTSNGVRITFQTETIDIVSADDRPLEMSDFNRGDLFDLWHVMNTEPEDNGVMNVISGTAGQDTLLGGGANDLVMGEFWQTGFDNFASMVYRVYRATLDREPDYAGHQNWTQALIGGQSLESVVAGFVNSPEFQSIYGEASDGEFVTLLYNNVLDRDPDEGGLAYWVGQIGGGTLSREQVVMGFSESAEFRGNTAGSSLAYSWAGHQSDWTGAVFRLYQSTLGREPELGGLINWTSEIANGKLLEDVATGFVNSAEFQATYGATTDSQFVTLLYNNVLDRDPDAGGLAFWVGQLGNGAMTREEVVLGFSQSPEFISASHADLVDYMRGLGGDDRVAGGTGDNILFGGWRSDTFVFNAKQEGTHAVVGFEAWDMIELQQFLFASSTEALAALAQSGDHVTLRQGDIEIIFENTALSDFAADTFVIV